MNNRLRLKLVTFNMLTIAAVFLILAVAAYYTTPRVVYHNSESGMIFSFIENRSEANTLVQLVQHTPALLLLFVLLGFSSLIMAEQAIKPIKRSWQRQQEFVADASHELRTPLATIKSNLEVVRDDPSLTVGHLQNWLENIDLEVKRMTSMVNQLLLLARIDSNQELLELKTFAVDKAIARALQPFAPEAAKKAIALTFTCEKEISCHGDETRLQQLIVILLDNAIKYTPDGGAITITIKLLGPWLRISVADTGIGIPEQQLPKIFDRFYRADPARCSSVGGSGLGLSIAAWIVTAHGGKISATSRPGKGSVFIVEIPRK